MARDSLSGELASSGEVGGARSGRALQAVVRSLDSVFQAMGSLCKSLIMKGDDPICFHSF